MLRALRPSGDFDRVERLTEIGDGESEREVQAFEGIDPAEVLSPSFVATLRKRHDLEGEWTPDQMVQHMAEVHAWDAWSTPRPWTGVWARLVREDFDPGKWLREHGRRPSAAKRGVLIGPYRRGGESERAPSRSVVVRGP